MNGMSVLELLANILDYPEANLAGKIKDCIRLLSGSDLAVLLDGLNSYVDLNPMRPAGGGLHAHI